MLPPIDNQIIREEKISNDLEHCATSLEKLGEPVVFILYLSRCVN